MRRRRSSRLAGGAAAMPGDLGLTARDGGRQGGQPALVIGAARPRRRRLVQVQRDLPPRPHSIRRTAPACAGAGRGAAARTRTTGGEWPPAARSVRSMKLSASAALNSRLGAAHAPTERRARRSAAPSAPARASAAARARDAPNRNKSPASAPEKRASATTAGASHRLPARGQHPPPSPAAPQRTARRGLNFAGARRAAVCTQHAGTSGVLVATATRPLQGPLVRRLQPSQARPGPGASAGAWL